MFFYEVELIFYVFYCSNGPQKCSACIKEDIFEDPTSILKQGCVSMSLLKKSGNEFVSIMLLGCWIFIIFIIYIFIFIENT